MSNCVLVSKASSTYPTGKELLLQLGVGRVRMSMLPVLASPAVVPGDSGAVVDARELTVRLGERRWRVRGLERVRELFT